MSQGTTVLAGDSLIERGEWAEILGIPDAVNRGVSGDTVSDLLARSHSLVSGRPRHLLLMVGINDLAEGRSPMEVAAGYERLLRSIKAESPSTHVFMQSVIPVNERLTSEPIANRTVRALNENLRVVARAEGAEFLDVSSALSEQAGELDARLTRDGIYLDGAGYAAWAEVLLGLER